MANVIGRAMPNNEIDDLREEVNQAKLELQTMSEKLSNMETQRLNYPLDSASQDVIRRAYQRFLPEDVMDIIWRDYFYYFDAPVIIDGPNGLATWSLTSSGGFFAAGASQLTLNTGDTSGNYAGAIKDWSVQNTLRFDRRQRFRTAFSVNNIYNTILYLVRGDAKGGADKYYGFKIVGSSLQGVTRNAGSEQTVTLMTISANTTYDLEAVFLPREKVVFSIRSSSDDKFFRVGALTSEIPVGTTSTEFFSIYAETSATEASKQMIASYVEYIQKR